ncbi:GNAT family N-acetyltransferase [Methylocapsa sp. S129]|uniref:GNAT family N-acetyltransferase n=1 Tax=Methylocapsa sp. S129 TaxID=1641869 RepID=UPI001FED5181|nr:GNAT family N-acetyltransferase [Methylocapsa sp. S129]
MTERDNSLAWRVERALQMAWPALDEQRCGDWLARFAPGVSRRSNSANPTRADLRNIDADIAACEAAYRARGLPAMFRLPGIAAPAADERLARLNYVAEGETVTLRAALAPGARDAEVSISARPDAAWLAAMAELQGQTPEHAAIYGDVVRSIAIPAGFASLREDGEWAALAYGAVSDRLLCCESVVAHPRRRGRGHGRRIMKALLAWAAEQGARDVCLQVAADNGPGRALYRSLGLTSELYRYHYRRAPNAA